MTKFCEDCPLRGRAVGELDAAAFMPVEGGTTDILTGRKRTTYRSVVGVVLDIDHNPSEPIRQGLETVDSILEKIDDCEEPGMTEQQGIFRTKYIKTCPAIGRLAIEPRTSLYDLVAREVAL